MNYHNACILVTSWENPNLNPPSKLTVCQKKKKSYIDVPLMLIISVPSKTN